MKTERTLSSRRVYRGRAVAVRLDEVETPSGRRATREVVEHGDSVVMVALDEQGRLLLVRQFRQAVGKSLLELPAGGVESGENLEECVRRELREEVGYLPKKVERLGGFYASPGYGTEYLHLYLAQELEPSPLEAEDTESIEVVAYPLSQIPQLIASGEIQDSKTIAGLYLALQYLNREGAKPG